MRFVQYFPLLLILTSQNIFANSCDFLPETEQPQWINGNPNINGYHVGVGLSEREDKNSQQQIEAARQSALKNLTSNIEVSIQQDMVISEQVTEDDVITTAKKEVKSITKIFSNASLKNIETDEMWLQRDNCVVWVRIKVPESIIDEIRNKKAQSKKLSTLIEHVDFSKNENNSTDARVENINLAKILLNEINFYVLDDPRGESYYRDLVSGVDLSVMALKNKTQTAKSLFLSAKQFLERADNSSTQSEKSDLISSATKNLNKVLADFEYNARESWAENAALRLGEIAKNKGNDCAAQYYFEHIKNHSLQSKWKIKSNGLLIGILCDDDKKNEFKWRNIFDGENVLLTCVYKTKNDLAYWEDLCDRIRNRISSYGAIIEEEEFSDVQLKNIVRRKHKSKFIKNLSKYNKKLLFIAKGTISKRKSRNNTGGRDYQFKGKISSLMLSGNKLEFSDKYSGAGGWNPISDDMAMEILGVHVDKRWYKKLSKSL